VLGGKRDLSDARGRGTRLFPPPCPERKRGTLRGWARELQGYWDAFAEGWIRHQQLCDRRKLSPSAAQKQQVLFLQDVFLVIC